MEVLSIPNIVLRLLTISQLLLFSMMILSSDNSAKLKTISLMIMLSMISYLAMPMIEIYTTRGDGLQWGWFPASIAAECLLLFVWFTFEEQSEPPSWMLALIIIGIGGSLWLKIYNIGLPDSPVWMQLIKIVTAGVALVVVLQGRQNDLVERRYKIRNLFVLAMAFLTLVIILVEFITDFSMPIKVSSISVLVMLCFAFALNIYFIRFNPNLELDTHQNTPIQSTSEDPLIQTLLSRMTDERLYADHDLRVGTLADLMNVPEYQLRKKINQQLGYRNFNQFVNRYRIEEAGERLLENTRIPVLSIALDVGFRSISSFNTAFQTQFGVSPTKYRAEAQRAS